MSKLRYISNWAILAFVGLTFLSCQLWRAKADVVYYIHPESNTKAEVKMADYLARHLQKRSSVAVVSIKKNEDNCDVTLHVGDDFGGDYAVRRGENAYYLAAKDERTMTWLVYQFIKYVSKDKEYMDATDLPPCIFPQKDTVATFPFEYRDIYMPANQNPDMTWLLGLNNLESDWGLWGHQLARVLGTNDDTTYGFQNMDEELFAHSGSMTYKDQFCFSSEKLYDLTVRYILDQYGDGSRTPSRITIGPNDNTIVCMCPRCQGIGNTARNATPAVTQFVEKLAKRFPKHHFFIPAYLTTGLPPTKPLPDNVGVFLSAIDYPRAWDNLDSPAARHFFDLMEQWKKVCKTIYVWDYICNFDDYITAYPILSVMQQRIQEYRRRGVKGIFLNGSGYFYSCLQEHFTFILANMLIDPDLDIDEELRTYYQDAMPHIGDFMAAANIALERRARTTKKEFPLYGGIKDAVKTYIYEPGFREYYTKFLALRDVEMTHRERVIYEKTRQNVSFTYMELVRLHGIGPGGFADKVEDEWEVKPEVLSALADLGAITPEEDIYILTNNDRAAMDHMDRVNENGIYLADYESECDEWLRTALWRGDVILGEPLVIHSANGTETNTFLTDGVLGISQNYHWGWQVFQQEGLVIELPADKIQDAIHFAIAFLNLERHRMSPPKDVQIWADGQMKGRLLPEQDVSLLDEGEEVVFRGDADVSGSQSVELRFTPSNTRDLALEEILVKL